MNDIELNLRELTGDDALRFARECRMKEATPGLFYAGVGDLIRFARLVRAGWTPPARGVLATVTKHGVTMPAAVWERIKDGIPSDYTEEEFRAYSAIQLAREQAAAGVAGTPAPQLLERALTAMRDVQERAEPGFAPDIARIPADDWRAFVDAHAELQQAAADGVAPSQAPSLREAAETMVRCAEMWEHTPRALPLNVSVALNDLREALSAHGVGGK
jgi:hypothetical protein